jgi:uncharacterized Zn finger protein|tara:strand:- start:93 stop:263 length:171 start_codon:yes stop_codon:yes gene_type:complete
MTHINVYCTKCSEFFDESDVDIQNIAEDFEGRDQLTFRCPDCGTIQTSLRSGSSYD